MAKFYQHINSDDPLFQKTTKLLYVDDSDPDLLLYVFDDGSKKIVAEIANTNKQFMTANVVGEIENGNLKQYELKRWSKWGTE